MGRNKSPSENTIRILCSKAAGMCEFFGCNKRLFFDNVNRKKLNNAYVAHIVASSINGPRGNKILSPLLSDKLENLMLMCADHHKLIDSDTQTYTVEVLKKMKAEHESRIDKMCSLLYVPQTEIICFTSPIKGTTEVEINYNLAADAVMPNKQASQGKICIFVSSARDYKDSGYWEECLSQLESQFIRQIFNPYSHRHKFDYSMFAVAPIPLIIKLGEMFGDKIPCDVYQKTRSPDTWKWQSSELTNKYELSLSEYECDTENVALVLSLTNRISDERISEVGNYKAVYRITAEQPGVDSVKSENDLSAFWHQYQKACEEILNKFGRDINIHLFPAVPVSAAFEIGRRYMPGVYPVITVFDECRGFFETIKIGGKDNDG